MRKTSMLLFCLLFFAGFTSKAQTNAAITDKFIKAVASGQYAEAAKLFDPSLQQLNAGVLEAGWKQITAMFGAYESYFLPEATDQNAATIITGIRFANGTQGFACNFNDQHQLVGFLMAPAPEDKSAPKPAVMVSRFKEEEIAVPVSGGTLKGTMMYPENATPATPVALIIAGSGATDRNCNNGADLNTNAYKMLAETLAEHGIASLRYDKRMIGQSNNFGTDESKLKFDDFVQDVVALCQYLKTEKQTSKIYLIGHSEGSLIAMLAAQKTTINAYVSICGAGENIAQTLKRQIPNEQAANVIDELKQGSMTNNVPSELAVTFRPSVQPYLISWMKYEPTTEIKKLKIPVLIIGGTTDLQVPVADAELLQKAMPKAQLMVVDGMNHILKDAIADKTANIVTYNQPNLPLNKEFAAGITSFLSGK